MKEEKLFKRIYPSDNPDNLEIAITEYIGQDILGTMLIYELLKTKENASKFINWLDNNNKKIEFEDALPFIIDLRIKDTEFDFKKEEINKELFELARGKDPKRYLTDEQIAFLTTITVENETDEEAIKELSKRDDNKVKYFKENDLRWLIFQLIMPKDSDEK